MYEDNNKTTFEDLAVKAQEQGLSITQVVQMSKKQGLGFVNTIISDEDKLIRDTFLKSEAYKFTKLGSNEAYFWNQERNKYLLFNSANFFSVFSGEGGNITPKVIKSWYLLIDFYQNSVKVHKENAYFLHNSINFKNGSFVMDKKSKVMVFSDDMKPSTYFVDRDIDLSINKLSPKMKDYLWEIGNKNEDDFNYLLDMLASVFLPNELVSKLFYIYGIGGKGKSDFIRGVINPLVGYDNVSNVKIDFFDERKSNKEFRLGDINGKLVNLDDDFSGMKLINTGNIKSVVTGKADFQADIKGEKPITFKPNCKIFINTNKKPEFANFDSGDRRRTDIYWYLADFDKWAKDNGRKYDFTFLKDKKEIDDLASFLVNRAVEISKHRERHFIASPNMKKATTYLLTNIDYMKKYFKSEEYVKQSRNIFVYDYVNKDETKRVWYINTKYLEASFNNYLKDIEDIDHISSQKVNNIIKEMGLVNGEKSRKTFEIKDIDINGEIKINTKRLYVYKCSDKLANSLERKEQEKER